MTPNECEQAVEALAARVDTVIKGQPLRVVIGALTYLLVSALSNPAHNTRRLVSEEPPGNWNRRRAQSYLVWLLDDMLVQLLGKDE